jgi:hypothetical protein
VVLWLFAIKTSERFVLRITRYDKRNTIIMKLKPYTITNIKGIAALVWFIIVAYDIYNPSWLITVFIWAVCIWFILKILFKAGTSNYKEVDTQPNMEAKSRKWEHLYDEIQKN